MIQGMVASPPQAGGLNSLALRQSLNDLIEKPLVYPNGKNFSMHEPREEKQKTQKCPVLDELYIQVTFLLIKVRLR